MQPFKSPVWAGLFFFDNRILGRGLGSFTATRFAFSPVRPRELPLAVTLDLVRRTSIGQVGRTAVASAEGRTYATSSLSDFVRVSCARGALTVVGSSTASSAGAIDAVTLVANNPPRTAREKAAIQTVLINLAPNARSLSRLPKNEFNQP